MSQECALHPTRGEKPTRKQEKNPPAWGLIYRKPGSAPAVHSEKVNIRNHLLLTAVNSSGLRATASQNWCQSQTFVVSLLGNTATLYKLLLH